MKHDMGFYICILLPSLNILFIEAKVASICKFSNDLLPDVMIFSYRVTRVDMKLQVGCIQGIQQIMDGFYAK